MPPLHSLTFLSLLLLQLLLSAPSPASSARCNPDDKRALLQTRKAIVNPYFIVSWMSDADCCDWAGVGCDPDTGRVTTIDMSGADISGPIPASLGGLAYLKELTIRKSANLTGPFPPRLAELSNVESLRLDWNGLNGPVPDFLGRMASLEYINLSFNELSGGIPSSLGDLPRLRGLSLDRNRLTGSIPESLGRLSQPDLYIQLSHNNLTGPIPASFGGLHIARIELGRNGFTGDPSAALFGASKNTFWIDLSRNLFEFDLTAVEFPSEIGILDLSHNKIYGKIPGQMTKLDYLQSLNLTYNRLCGEIPGGARYGRHWRAEPFDESSFVHNRCLCGPPLPPCK